VVRIRATRRATVHQSSRKDLSLVKRLSQLGKFRTTFPFRTDHAERVSMLDKTI
jgi:hypothetical protein